MPGAAPQPFSSIGRYDDQGLDADISRTREQAERSDDTVWVQPGNWEIWGSATKTALGPNRFKVLNFPASSDSRASVIYQRPRTWAGGGYIRATIWYSGTSTSNDFDIQQIGFEPGEGDTVAGIANQVNAEESLDPPGSAGELMKHVFTNRFTVDCDGAMLTYQLRRDGADSNAGPCYIFGVELRFHREHA